MLQMDYQVDEKNPGLYALQLANAPAPQADTDRKHMMSNAWKAYRGDLQDPLKVRANQPNDNIKTNRCAPIVDKGVSFLFGSVLKIECREHQGFIDRLWGNDDDRMTLLSQAAINGGVCGQVFFRLIPPQGELKAPRIVVLDPMLIRVVTAPDDCSLVQAYIIEYSYVNGVSKKQIISRVDPDKMAGIAGQYDYDDTWLISDFERRGQAGAWAVCGEPSEWAHPFPPIFCCQNLPNPNEAWGTPDLTADIIDMNRVLNFLQSNVSRILKFHAHPKTYAVGLNSTQINIGIDDLICLPSENAKLANLEMQSDLSSSLHFIASVRDSMDEQSRVPGVSLGRMENLPRGTMSGVALQLLFQPLMEKTIQKQRLYGRLIRDVSQAALVVSGLVGVEKLDEYPVELHWKNLLPVDDLAAAQTALILQQLGVSDNTLLQQLGYNPEDESEKVRIENQMKLLDASRGQALPVQTVNAQQEGM